MWFKIRVTEGTDVRVDFLIRSDNLYLSGFTNKHDTFAFKVEWEYRMQASRSLSFGSSYPQLFGDDGFRGLGKLPISKTVAINHLNTLANYRGGQDSNLKVPLAFFVLVICEAERFHPLRSEVTAHWDQTTATTISNARLIKLVVNWRDFSCALLDWSRYGQTQAAWTRAARRIQPFGVATAQHALAIVYPILLVANC
jgi:hypothetical protein